MTPVYKIKVPKATYEQILLPIANELELELSAKYKNGKVVVFIENDSIARTLKCVLIRKIDDYEVVQSAFSRMQNAALD
ncbi:hypothetical protein [Pedobacter endophyticus]|uniref:Uncharacterized protein n=1 Tax=Pedobacter endophyticus TaxID=2789740 RepID=A0A7S9L140_9SPHI|nr:hypothetical protein [Pedobacter endophyticus]QPH40547.1 hypothetical protein IZT61_04500 [Pedobacter endophyticus]